MFVFLICLHFFFLPCSSHLISFSACCPIQAGKERSPSVQGDNSITSLPISIPLSTVHPSKLPVSIPLASVVLPSRVEKLVRTFSACTLIKKYYISADVKL